ncbi:hypothetical protein [Consotaella aegiceratis]|uniref:hypothetical protein n=1 Tax=Consotaella aegiceratis TaxID=3097961 RepID=UPI002F3E60E3
MAITFPRPLPSIEFDVESQLDLVLSVSQARSGNRLTNIVEFADPVWMASMETQPLYPEDCRAVSAWWDSLRGGLRTVLFREPSYSSPIGQIGNRGPELTPGTVSSITNGNEAAISGVDAGLVLDEGDYVSFTAVNGVRHLGRVSDAAGSGTSRTVAFEPPAPIGLDLAGAVARFDRAELLMRPVSGSFNVSVTGGLKVITFQLVESAS